jgi:hypothetical protein
MAAYNGGQISLPMSVRFGLGEKLAGRTWAKALTAGVAIQPELLVPEVGGVTVPLLITIGSHVLPFGD